MRYKLFYLTFFAFLFIYLPTAHAIAPPLKEGDQGDDVISLQETLKEKGFFSYPVITGFFGKITKLAVKDFQEAYREIVLEPIGLIDGTGYVGSFTAAAFNSKRLPKVTLIANPIAIAPGDSTTLVWNALNATSCTASDGWSGTVVTSGTKIAQPTANTTYTISCTNAYKKTTVTSVSVSLINDPTPPQTATFKINSSAGPNGTISPSGSVDILANTSPTYTVTPNTGYQIASVVVDGDIVTPASTFTFTNVTNSHDIVATFSLSTSSPAGPNPPQTIAPCYTNCDDIMSLSNGNKIPYYRNYPITEINEGIDHAVIVVHGLSRGVDSAYTSVLSAARTAGTASTSIIIAPYFQATSTPDQLSWPSSSWKKGNTSAAPGTMSSFAVVDDIISQLALKNTFPSLKSITIIGHSAGGQFTNRYAAGTQIESLVSIPLHYVVANPSSYLYLNKYRAIDTTATKWYVPNTNCTSYDNYHYGLNSLNSYMKASGITKITENYPAKNVTYLLGDDDIYTDTTDFDDTCEGMFEGPNRYERGLMYYEFLKAYYPSNVHKKVIVPGAGHSAREMYTSTAGIETIFQSN